MLKEKKETKGQDRTHTLLHSHTSTVKNGTSLQSNIPKIETLSYGTVNHRSLI